MVRNGTKRPNRVIKSSSGTEPDVTQPHTKDSAPLDAKEPKLSWFRQRLNEKKATQAAVASPKNCEVFEVERRRFYLSIHWPSVVYTSVIFLTALVTIYHFYVKRKTIKNSNLEFWRVHNYECTCTKSQDCDD